MCLYWFLALSSTLVAEMIDGSIRCESEGVAHWDWPWIHCALFALLGDERRVFFFRGSRPRSKPSENSSVQASVLRHRSGITLRSIGTSHCGLDSIWRGAGIWRCRGERKTDWEKNVTRDQL